MTTDERKFRGLEIAMDNIRMEEQLLPPGYSLEEFPSKNQPYFKQYGFKVSRAFSAIYEKANGIASDKYIPASLYFYYISPYLMNMNMTMAYVDKNNYCRLFPKVKQPITICHNINGRFYNCLGGGQLAFDDVIGLLSGIDEYIIKPAIESGRGRDVMLVRDERSRQKIEEILKSFDSDFIIQHAVKQHPTLSLLNPTSLNTCRVYTYLPVDTTEHVILGAAVRFGGKGAYRDNACTGGGFCKVHEDGRIDDRICQYRFLGRRSLKEEKGIVDLKFPSFEKVIGTCLKMHRQLPYMDLVGWDIAVNEEGEPVLIELNQYPDCEFIQLFNGPMFGEYTDDLLSAISKSSTRFVTVAKRHFPLRSAHHDYNFEIGKQYSI